PASTSWTATAWPHSSTIPASRIARPTSLGGESGSSRGVTLRLEKNSLTTTTCSMAKKMRRACAGLPAAGAVCIRRRTCAKWRRREQRPLSDSSRFEGILQCGTEELLHPKKTQRERILPVIIRCYNLLFQLLE